MANGGGLEHQGQTSFKTEPLESKAYRRDSSTHAGKEGKSRHSLRALGRKYHLEQMLQADPGHSAWHRQDIQKIIFVCLTCYPSWGSSGVIMCNICDSGGLHSWEPSGPCSWLQM